MSANILSFLLGNWVLFYFWSWEQGLIWRCWKVSLNIMKQEYSGQSTGTQGLNTSLPKLGMFVEEGLQQDAGAQAERDSRQIWLWEVGNYSVNCSGTLLWVEVRTCPWSKGCSGELGLGLHSRTEMQKWADYSGLGERELFWEGTKLSAIQEPRAGAQEVGEELTFSEHSDLSRKLEGTLRKKYKK